MLGISYSAKDAFDAAVNSCGAPDAAAAVGCQGRAFDRVGLVLPGRRLGLNEIAAGSGRPGHRLRVAILAGQYDHANLATARGVRQALRHGAEGVPRWSGSGHSAVTFRSLGARRV